MNNIQTFVYIMMIFCHIVDDFYLQGILAQLKQKDWWWNNASQDTYKHDYIVALIIHALSWSIMIHLPLMIYTLINNINNGMLFITISIGINMVIHGLVDDAKANRRKINLQVDQIIHFLQIWEVFALFNMIIGEIR